MARRNVQEKVSWTEVMKSDLLSCKEKAMNITSGENPPRYPNGRKIGYMKYMLDLWNELGYGHLNLTSQNLSDRARDIERKQKQKLQSISETIDEDRINVATTSYNQNVNVINSEIPVESNLLSDDLLNRLKGEAEKVFKDITAVKGDYSSRHFKTRFRKAPTNEEINYINNACEVLLIQNDVKRMLNTLDSIWIINCIVYSVISGWIIINDIKGMQSKQGLQKGKCATPKCILIIEKEIKSVRALISKTVAELNRIQVNGRLTRRSKRNRKEILKGCGTISSYNLTCYIEKLKKRIKYLSRKRSRKIRSEKARIINMDFVNDPKKVFDKFRTAIEKDPENLEPVYKEYIEEKRYFEKAEEVEAFWADLWGSADKGNPGAPWTKEFEEKFTEIVPEVHEGNLEINKTVVLDAIRKKKNWSAPGPDMIVNFWWKKLTSVIEVCTVIFYNIVNVEMSIEMWLSIGRVALIPKDGEWTVSNQRPITCLNTLYKWLTSILLIFHNVHLNKYNLLQVDQRGAKQKSTGTVNNLLIDDTVMGDAVLRKRNLYCYWVDVRKAFDSVSHSWLIKMLEIHRFPKKLVTIFNCIMQNWNVQIAIPVKDGLQTSRMISLNNGILQGDSYCPGLYVLTMNLISWVLRSTEGYVLSTPVSQKVTHVLYVDDLKGYAKSLERLKFVLNFIKSCMGDAGLYWNAKKCKFIGMRRGKYEECENLALSGGDIIKCLKEDESYEFLGVPQCVKMNVSELSKQLLKVVKQRAYIIWSSELSDANKCMACNQFINSAIEYYLWAAKFPINSIREMDTCIRDVMNHLGAKHTNLMNAVNYLPRNMGGRGLRSLEDTYKATKIKLAIKLVQDTDQRLKLVKAVHNNNVNTKSFSLFKDAMNYSSELGFSLEISDANVSIAGNERNEEINVNTISKKLKEKRIDEYHTDILNSTWQGVNMKQRLEDENVEKTYFNWIKNWKMCPTNTVNEFLLLFYQMLPTRCYKKERSSEAINDVRCRLCGSDQESVKHIISNCGSLANSLYKSRHDNALKCFVWPLLQMFGLIDKSPTWYAEDKVKPYYENDDVKFWWDIPEHTGRDDEPALPPRPDGKIMFERDGEKKLFLIEMTVPWTQNRLAKFEYKSEKYIRILENLQFEHREYKVDQITVVMDVFGGHGKDLSDNLSKVIKEKSSVTSIINNMQKSIISSAANLSRTFKIRSTYTQ